MRKVGIVDIGSNSMIFLLMDEKGKVLMERVEEWGIGGYAIPPFSLISRMKESISNFEKICKENNAEIHVFGTEYFRKHPEIFKELVGCLPGKILSEEEEAMYSYISTLDMEGDDRIVVDLGGGSLEIIKKEGFESLKIGTHVLNKEFKLSQPYDGPIDPIVEWIFQRLPDHEGKTLIGIGGTFVSVAAFKRKVWDLESLHGAVLHIEGVESILETVKKMSYDDLKKLRYLPRGREKTILSGLCITFALMKKYLPQMTVSTKGFRHAIAWDILKNGELTYPWKKWRARGELNPQPPDPQSGALSC